VPATRPRPLPKVNASDSRYGLKRWQLYPPPVAPQPLSLQWLTSKRFSAGPAKAHRGCEADCRPGGQSEFEMCSKCEAVARVGRIDGSLADVGREDRRAQDQPRRTASWNAARRNPLPTDERLAGWSKIFCCVKIGVTRRQLNFFCVPAMKSRI
jgi:hypothetical protein